MRKLISLKLILIISAVSFFGLSSTALAKYYGYGYSLDVIGYKQQGVGVEYITNEAAKRWNNAAKTRIGPGPNSNNLIAYYEYSDSWYGLYRPSPLVPGGVTRFRISINKRTLSNLRKNTYPNSTLSALAVNTTVHELGHALFLGDYPSGYGDKSIMSYERNRTNSTPRTQDVQEVKKMRGY